MRSNDQALIEALQRNCSVPEWAQQVLIRAGHELPGEKPLGVLEDQIVDASYLEFLREQIELDARGPEWTSLLSARLHAFESLVGQRLRRIEVRSDAAVILGYLRLDQQTVVHIEIHPV